MEGPGEPRWYQCPATAIGAVDATDPGRLRVTVSAATLIHLLAPLETDPWDVGGVQPHQVHAALAENRLRAHNPAWEDRPAAEHTATGHAERIAWLIRHGWDTSNPLMLDVDQYGAVALVDGNHRLYALAMLELQGPVIVELSGYIDIAEDLLDVTIP